MDHSEQQHAQKSEPSLAPADRLAPAPDADLPVWLSKPPAPESSGQRWGRRIKFLGIAIATVAIAGGATKIGLDLYESNTSMAVVADTTQSESASGAAKPAPQQQAAAPIVEKPGSALPPLVLVPPDPAHKKDGASATAPATATGPGTAPATVTAAPGAVMTPAVTPPAASAKPEVVPAPEAKVALVPPVPNKAEKTPAVSAKPVKVAAPAAKAVEPGAKPKLAAAKKPVLAPKHANGVVLAKAKPVKGTMLQPPRERGVDPAFQPPMREAVDRRCHAGELARECAERAERSR